MADIFLRFKLRVEVNDKEVGSCIQSFQSLTKVKQEVTLFPALSDAPVSCTRLRILLNTICRKSGFNSLRTPLNHGAEQASNETLKQTQQRK